MNQIFELARPHIRNLCPYSSARDEFQANSGSYVFLDANENPVAPDFTPEQNRYPDSKQELLRTALAKYLSLSTQEIFLGNGSDEAIDLLIRTFCEPEKDEILIFPPTYGMYKVSARMNNVGVREVNLSSGYELDNQVALESLSNRTKLIFVCNPNNPTGNVFDQRGVLELLESPNFRGLLVVDEAYVDFCPEKSFIKYLKKYERLVILRTFSKAWGLAGIRLGMALGSREIIDLLMRVKPPYNVSSYAQDIALFAIEHKNYKDESVSRILTERDRLAAALRLLPRIRVFPSECNFLLVQVPDANEIYKRLIEQKIVIRNRSKEVLCNNCLRITVGTREENDRVVSVLSNFMRRI